MALLESGGECVGIVVHSRQQHHLIEKLGPCGLILPEPRLRPRGELGEVIEMGDDDGLLAGGADSLEQFEQRFVGQAAWVERGSLAAEADGGEVGNGQQVVEDPIQASYAEPHDSMPHSIPTPPFDPRGPPLHG